jgi:LysR family transcriptional regulator for bpeEF and oprC
MDRFESMQVFTKVVDLHSFSRAADSLGLQRSAVTKMVRKLEAHLQTQLLRRTTRSLDVTTEGTEYYHHCLRILSRLDETEDMFTSIGNRVRGRLRVQMPAAIGRLCVLPAIERFRERFPEVDLMIGLDDRPFQQIDDDLDCSIQTGLVLSAAAVQRKVGEIQMLTAASPTYLRRNGEPLNIKDLITHYAIHRFPSTGEDVAHFLFEVNGNPVETKMRASLAMSDVEGCVSCSVDGMGLVQAPQFILEPYLKSGALLEVLNRWRPRPSPVIATYPDRRDVPLKARMFVEWIAELFEGSLSLTGDQSDLDQARHF